MFPPARAPFLFTAPTEPGLAYGRMNRPPAESANDYSASWPANGRSEELRLAQRGAALLALDRERRRDGCGTARTPMSKQPPALRTGGRKLGFVLEEVAQRVPTGETERDPVSERLSPLLLDPVAPGACHAGTVVLSRPRAGTRARRARGDGPSRTARGRASRRSGSRASRRRSR